MLWWVSFGLHWRHQSLSLYEKSAMHIPHRQGNSNSNTCSLLTDSLQPPLCSQSPCVSVCMYIQTHTHTCIVLDSWPGSAKASCWSESWSTEQWTVYQINIWSQVSHWGEERWGRKRRRRRRGGGGRRRGRWGGGGRRGIKEKQGWWISRWLGKSYVHTYTFPLLITFPPSCPQRELENLDHLAADIAGRLVQRSQDQSSAVEEQITHYKENMLRTLEVRDCDMVVKGCHCCWLWTLAGSWIWRILLWYWFDFGFCNNTVCV